MENAIPFGIVLLIGLFTTRSFCQGKFRFANFYGDHMVLQRAPRRAVVWGFGNVGQSVMLSLNGKEYTTETAGSGQWNITLDAISDPGPFTIIAKSQNDVITLKDVLFGDVWVCSGQNNMGWPVGKIIRAKQEQALASSGKYSQIRLFTAARKMTKINSPKDEFSGIQQSWSEPNSGTISRFSAVCWVYGRLLNEKLKRPIGLVQAVDSGGAFGIELWMSPEALAQCNARLFSFLLPLTTGQVYSRLWNSMIHPISRSTITGALWYQGEANSIGFAGRRPEDYSCTFPAMINDWRGQFHKASGGQTSEQFPFGFAQLSGFRVGNISRGFTDIRWHSTAEFGDVPNSVLENVFMAVTMDLNDNIDRQKNDLYPKYKTDVGRRLSLGGLALAYGQKVQFRGPFPRSIHNDRAAKTITVAYKYGPIRQPTVLKNGEIGFEICCSATDHCNTWSKVDVKSSNSTTVTLSYSCATKVRTLRYAWRETPCLLKHCQIYSVSGNLPAPPFVFDLDQRSSVTSVIG